MPERTSASQTGTRRTVVTAGQPTNNTRSGTARNATSGRCSRRSASSWPARASRSSKAYSPSAGTRTPTTLAVAYVVLAAAGVAEGISFARAYRQMRGEAKARRTSLAEHVRRSPDTTVKAALFEDSVAMIGLVFATAGVGLRQLTGSAVWDGAASIAIGVLLILAAIRLGLDSRDLLIGRAADPRELADIRREIETTSGVTDLIDLQTMHLGPDHLIVAARVFLDDDIDADDAENLADRLDRRLAEILPQAPHVFIDPTQRVAGYHHDG